MFIAKIHIIFTQNTIFPTAVFPPPQKNEHHFLLGNYSQYIPVFKNKIIISNAIISNNYIFTPVTFPPIITFQSNFRLFYILSLYDIHETASHTFLSFLCCIQVFVTPRTN